MDTRTPKQRFDAAIEGQDFDEAVIWSRVLPELSLADDLRLTLLSARRSPAQFGDLVRAWLARALSEGLIDRRDLHSVMSEMDAVRNGTSDGSVLLRRVRMDESAWPRG